MSDASPEVPECLRQRDNKEGQSDETELQKEVWKSPLWLHTATSSGQQ